MQGDSVKISKESLDRFVEFYGGDGEAILQRLVDTFHVTKMEAKDAVRQYYESKVREFAPESEPDYDVERYMVMENIRRALIDVAKEAAPDSPEIKIDIDELQQLMVKFATQSNGDIKSMADRISASLVVPRITAYQIVKRYFSLPKTPGNSKKGFKKKREFNDCHNDSDGQFCSAGDGESGGRDSETVHIQATGAEIAKLSTCSRAGACIPSAYEDLTNKFRVQAQKGDAVLVHGWIYSPSLDKDIKHAWVEVEGKVWEPVTETMLDEKWMEILKPRPVKRYDLGQAMIMSVKTRSRGGEFQFESAKKEYNDCHNDVNGQFCSDSEGGTGGDSKTLTTNYTKQFHDDAKTRLFGKDTNKYSKPGLNTIIARETFELEFEIYNKANLPEYNISEEELTKAGIPTVAQPLVSFEDWLQYRITRDGGNPFESDEAAREAYGMQYYTLVPGSDENHVIMFRKPYVANEPLTLDDRKRLYLIEAVGHEKRDQIYTQSQIEERLSRYSRFAAANPDALYVKEIAKQEARSAIWNAEWEKVYQETPSFFRGTSMGELLMYNKTGEIGGDFNGYNYVAASASATVAAGFSGGVVIEYDGDSVRSAGKRVQYSATPTVDGVSASINNWESMDRPMKISYAHEMEVRLPEGHSVESLNIKSISLSYDVIGEKYRTSGGIVDREAIQRDFGHITPNIIITGGSVLPEDLIAGVQNVDLTASAKQQIMVTA